MLHLSIDGPDSASFTLHLGTTEVPLVASGVTSAPGLVATLRNVAMLSGVLTMGSEADFLIMNQGSTAVTLGDGSISGTDLTSTSWDLAGKTIEPGGAIEAKLQFFQFVRGCTAGTFTVASSEATLAIPITSRMLGGVAIYYFGGAGSGRIVSSPPGIDCHSGEGTCTWVFSDERVELTATPDVGSHFSGWLGGCAYDPTCAGSPQPFSTGRGPVLTHVDPYFASPEAKAVTLHVTGSGAGTVTGDETNAGPMVTCAHDCTMWLEPGTSLALHAQTPSMFGGWGGACTSADKHCDLPSEAEMPCGSRSCEPAADLARQRARAGRRSVVMTGRPARVISPPARDRPHGSSLGLTVCTQRRPSATTRCPTMAP